MPTPQISSYGTWKSPITSNLIVSEGISLGQIALDGEDTYWVEMRPSEGGRNVIVRRAADGQTFDITPAPFNVRTRVHEYGGGAFAVSDGIVYFSNFSDQRIYRQEAGRQPYPITPEGDWRYADGIIDAQRDRIICVGEDHSVSEKEAVNSIISLSTDGGRPAQVLASGADFYASPRLNPDGTTLAWLSWDHPNMPWDGSHLWTAPVKDDGTLGNGCLIAGGASESIFQPAWSPNGTLYYVSDRSAWWNLYRWHNGSVEPVCHMEAEFGKPHWVFGTATYGFLSEHQIICTYNQPGIWRIGRLNTLTKELTTLDIPYTEMGRGDIKVAGERVVFEAGSATEPMSLLQLDPDASQPDTIQIEVLRRSTSVNVDPEYLTGPQTIEFPTDNGLTAHAFYYPPKNRDFAAPAHERPPLLVKSHGGPTGATSSSLDLSIQYWSSRGFAVLDVNYGGSTGYGRRYRERLEGNWGIVDVADCVHGALHLVGLGLADPERLAIDGGSAGGYTTLAVLTFRDVFKAGASYYGVSDLEALARETHKFESRYLDGLIGPYPERRDRYVERSPINFTHLLACPLILFQGLEDRVVPPNQAEMMFESVRQKGLPTAYVAFEGEQHGFRNAANIKRALDAELYFYSRVFGFEPADPVEPVPIENL